MLCPVRPHKAFHSLYELPFIVRKLHIYEISYYDTAEVPQPELTGNFFSSFQVRFKGILFLVIAYTFIPAVHIDHMKGFGMLYDQVGSTGQVDSFPKCGFYLFGDTEMIKNGRTVIIV